MFKTRWIVSAKYDLFFFMGSCIFAFAFLGLYRIALAYQFKFILNGEAILVTYFFFTAIFDHPHIFQTFARTHLDQEEFQRRKFLHTWGILGFILAGLAISLAGYDSELILFASIFGSYHIIRQHYGFLRAYKGLNQDREPLDNWLDYSMFYTGMFACFFNDYTEQQNNGYITIYANMKAWFPNLPTFLPDILWGIFIVLLALFLARQVWKLLVGEPINLPKLLLLTTALGTHYFIFFVTATPFLIAEAIETAYHDVQYQGWIMHYQRKRYPNRRGMVGKWLFASLAYGLLIGLLEVYGLWKQGWLMLLFVPFTMIVIYHYWVDGLIWRFSQDKTLRETMFGAPPALEKDGTN